jgi:phenylpropionate dioxygenase-like ring-hydroxylating dioxygenase large terminal subunit
MSDDAAIGADAYARHGIPPLGFRNYWYPVIESRKLRRRPRSIRVLGEDIVVFRDRGEIFALEDRCPHRGVKLSLGACQFPGSGTISCPYHGWTFDGATGALVAALMEGPDAAIVGKVKIKRYPVAQHGGLVFVFVGDMAAPPLVDDLPEFMADPQRFFSISVHADYRCNWRALVDNWPHDHHGPYLHRTSPELLFQPILPFAQKVETDELDGKKGLGLRGSGGITEAAFPGLGRFPRRSWYRFLKPVGRGDTTAFSESRAHRLYGMRHLFEIRLPGLVVVGRRSGEYCLVQWAVPIDETTTRLFNINNFRRRGRLRAAYDRVHYFLWRGWAHDRLFSGQDKRILEAGVPGGERLSRTDLGLIAWRKFAGANARQPPAASGADKIRRLART